MGSQKEHCCLRLIRLDGKNIMCYTINSIIFWEKITQEGILHDKA